MNNSFINVYKASAGAGKTFTLAAEFIANLINDYSGASAPHRHQLAITFTKKATTEMKERILEYLYELSHSNNAEDNFYKAVRERVRSGISEKEIRRRAGIVLLEIIHGYDRFHVTTIDSFFQSLLTNLAHELGLSANFKIDLNDRDVLGRGVERMLREMKDGSEVLKWVTDYIEERLDDDKAWNVTGVIKKLSEELLKEPYLIHGDKLRQLPLNNLTVSAYRKTLAQLKASAQKVVQQQAQDVNDFIEQTHGYDAISNGKRWGQGFILRIANWEMKNPAKDSQPSATLQKWAAEPLSMKKKTQKGVDDSWYEDVAQRLDGLFTQIPQALFTINSCDLSTRHLNPLRLLEEINASVEHINLDNNAFMLAHTPILFTKMVTDGEASFVFERAGTQFRHVMIDEFQDTSTLQWHNLRNLFLENIAQGNSCMLVGDVKQGIYRWRGGDWKTLSEIKDDEITTVKPLEDNFRSGKTIVEFNNRLFVEAAKVLDEKESEDRRDITEIYNPNDVYQHPRNEGGFVRICLEQKLDKDQDDADPAEFVAERELGEQILRLNQAGVPFEKMAILVRYNSESQAILQYFEENEEFADIPLVSDEAFLLASSPAVQTIIHALRYVLNKSDGIAEAYLRRHLPEGGEGEEALFHLLNQWKDLRYRDIPFYELVERLIQLFRLNEQTGQTPYLYAFLDAVLLFLDDNVPDLKRFLQHWDEVLYKQSIPSAVVEGVRILTIHKSKGLAFHSVFIPYCDWEVEKDRNDDILWLQPETKPYSDLPLIPVPMTSSAENSIYAEDYRNEHLHRRIENLNLMYVAFTRARQNLVVCGSASKATMSEVLNHALFHGEAVKEEYREQLGEARIVETDLPCTIIEWNEPSTLECEKKKKKEEVEDETKVVNPLKFSRENETLNFTSYAPKIAFRQSINARRFQDELIEEHTLQPEADAPQAEISRREKAETARLKGELLHRMMEHIERVEDVERVVRQFAAEGLIPSTMDREELVQMLRKAMSHPTAVTWFDGSWRLYRECNILRRAETGELSSLRPDRVMMRDGEIVIIDFKFGAPHEAHHDQVRKYAELLQDMGHTRLRGYLWYMSQDHIEDVALYV